MGDSRAVDRADSNLPRRTPGLAQARFTLSVRRVARHLAVVALVGVCWSCARHVPTAPAPEHEWRGFALLDSYARPGQVTLRWNTSTNPPCIDLGCPPPGPRIDRVRVFQSRSGLTLGFARIHSTRQGGIDSTLVTGLDDGRAYWFQVVAYDSLDRELLRSDPVVTIPGPVLTAFFSVPVRLSGRFDWSPSGDSIAYVETPGWGRYSVVALDLRTLTTRRLTRETSGDPDLNEVLQHAAWSPRGRGIAYVYATDSPDYQWRARIWEVSLMDTSRRVLSPGPADYEPAWGGGRWLYLCRGAASPLDVQGIWRLDPDSAESLRPVGTVPGALNVLHPAVRSSDDLIACEVERLVRGRVRRSIHLLSPATGGARMLVSSDAWSDWGDDTSPSWAPDGRHVLFLSRRSGHTEVWSVDVPTGRLAQVTRSPCWPRMADARISPDGRRLAVTVWGGGPDRLVVCDLPGALP